MADKKMGKRDRDCLLMKAETALHYASTYLLAISADGELFDRAFDIEKIAIWVKAQRAIKGA